MWAMVLLLRQLEIKRWFFRFSLGHLFTLFQVFYHPKNQWPLKRDGQRALSNLETPLVQPSETSTNGVSEIKLRLLGQLNYARSLQSVNPIANLQDCLEGVGALSVPLVQ